MFLTAEFMYESRGILGFFLRNHSPRRYFQKTETGKYFFQVTVNAEKRSRTFGFLPKNYSSSGKVVLYIVKRIGKDLSEEVY